MKGKEYLQKITVIILLLTVSLGLLFYKVPLYYQLRSYLVMYFYSIYEEKQSLIKKQNILIDIPGGTSTREKDWYPFVMVFNDDYGFSRYMGRDLALTILYNFGAFDWKQSSSSYYFINSPYYNSFYGGYIVRDNSGKKFGFTPEGEPDLEEIFSVPEYDFKYLVLQSLGCPEEKMKMELKSCEITKDVEYAKYKGWIKIDSVLETNSPVHKYKVDRRAYIQYGNPFKGNDQEDFELMTMRGRIYARYFDQFGCTVFLYIMTPAWYTLEECDRKILSKTVIGKSMKV